jgi:hypothetical protein
MMNQFKIVWIQLEFDFGIMETIDQSLNMRQA